jgi:ABC-type antimicrobial peptide transport system permease subunit
VSFLKNLLRTPAKTFITFLLLAAVSFALFSRVAEYSVSNRELNRIAANLQGVGAVERTSPLRMSFEFDDALMLDERIPDALKASIADYEQFTERRYTPLTKENIEAISALPYVNRTSTRYMTAGVSEDGFFRVNDSSDFYNYTQRLVIEGRFNGFHHSWHHPNTIHMSNLNVLAGNDDILIGPTLPFLLGISMFSPDLVQNPGGFVFTASNIISSTAFFPEFDFDFRSTLKQRERYVFTACFNAGRWLTQPVFTGDRAMQIQFPTILPLENQPENYLELDEFADLRALIELIEDDRRTFDMVYTDDMMAISRFREGSMRITSGRMLEASDRFSCVVSRQFINHSKLSIGDTITMRLGDALHSQNSAIGALSVIQERRPDSQITVTLEIVGVYDNFDSQRQQTENPFWNYSRDTFFVPLSLLPETADTASQKIIPSEFSFIVKARDIPKFLNTSAPLIEDMGLTLIFADGGWAAIESQFAVSEMLSLIAITSIFCAVLITFALTVFLFIGRKKKDYAIMRALGATKSHSNRSLFIPLLIIALSAIIAGGVSGIIYSGRLIEDSLAPLAASGYNINTSVPLLAVIICILVETAVLCGFTALELRRLGAKSPLDLLQGDIAKTRKKDRKTKIIAASANAVSTGKFKLPDFSALPRKYGRMRFIARYMLIRSRRALSKTLLLFLLAGVFTAAIGQFAVMRYSFEDIYENMEITGTFINGLHIVNANLVAEQDFAKNPYYELIQHGTEIGEVPVVICMTSDINRFIGSTQTRVEYAPGFDETFLSGGEFYCMLSADVMKALGLEFGDEAQLYRTGIREGLEINRTMSDELKAINLRRASLFFTVIGQFESDHPDFKHAVFLPFETDIMTLFRGVPEKPRFTFAEYTLTDNSKAGEFQEYARWMLGALDGGRSFIMDTGLLDSVVSNMRLFSALLPVISAALIITGGLLPGLITMQSSKEAAIFRILGTSKKRTRSVLIIQQLLLCFFGIALGIIAVRLYNGAELTGKIAPTLLLCAGLYFAACVFSTVFSAISITKRKVLDLLQTKE